MDSRFAKKLTYPEFTTHHSIMLNRSPGESEVPPAGSIYQWETVADDTVYINVKFSDGTIQSYPLDPQANTWEPPDSHVAVEDQMEFSPNDISEGVLTLPNNQSIADIGLYTDGTKAERTIISLPVVVTADATRIDFTGIDPEDYAYGGIIRFSRGIVYLYDDEFTYFVPTAAGHQHFDASLGRTQIVRNISSTLYISKENMDNLPENKLLKIIVEQEADGAKDVYVDGERVVFNRFMVGYINLNGTVMRVGIPTQIG